MRFILLIGVFTVWGVEFISASKELAAIAEKAYLHYINFFQSIPKLITGIECGLPPTKCPTEHISFWSYPIFTPIFGLKLTASNFTSPEFLKNSNTTLKVIIHDFQGERDDSLNEELRSAYMSCGHNKNIFVDYSNLAKPPCYQKSTLKIPLIAECTAGFLENYVKWGLISWDSIHIIGLGRGAQIAGQIYKYLGNGVKPYRITGLNPTGPLFDGVVQYKLTQEAANFVDAIHTNAVHDGIKSGHVDFYVNGAFMQPGCMHNDKELPLCSHEKSLVYFTESIKSPEAFLGTPCEDYVTYLTGACKTNKSNMVPMGQHTPVEARGNFYVGTEE